MPSHKKYNRTANQNNKSKTDGNFRWKSQQKIVRKIIQQLKLIGYIKV
jgi:ribosomal protein S19E (S16A)